ncbi:MAG: hypothetical protein U0232_14600 [Thermomicrobiales bacterium]
MLARTGAERVALVGKFARRECDQELRQAWRRGRVSHAVVCGTPNHGVVAIEGSNNEFNALGRFLRELNAGEEVTPGVAFMAIRSERDDLYAQPTPAWRMGTGYASPELRGATNVVLPGTITARRLTGRRRSRRYMDSSLGSWCPRRRTWCRSARWCWRGESRAMSMDAD